MRGTMNPEHRAGHKKRIKTVRKPDINRQLGGINEGY
jgi:hypothetical protein